MIHEIDRMCNLLSSAGSVPTIKLAGLLREFCSLSISVHVEAANRIVALEKRLDELCANQSEK